jgi:hypothetical protein
MPPGAHAKWRGRAQTGRLRSVQPPTRASKLRLPAAESAAELPNARDLEAPAAPPRPAPPAAQPAPTIAVPQVRLTSVTVPTPMRFN